MLRKIIFGVFLSLLNVSAFAGNYYVAGSLSYDSIKAENTGVRYLGYTPRIALGYGTLLIDRMYLSLEAFFADGSIVHKNQTQGIGSLKPEDSFGVGLLPGLILDDAVMAYLRLGGISTRFKEGGRKRGFQVGGGLEASWCKPWTIRGEYVYTVYNSISGIGQPKLDEFTLALVYRFL